MRKFLGYHQQANRTSLAWGRMARHDCGNRWNEGQPAITKPQMRHYEEWNVQRLYELNPRHLR